MDLSNSFNGSVCFNFQARLAISIDQDRYCFTWMHIGLLFARFSFKSCTAFSPTLIKLQYLLLIRYIFTSDLVFFRHDFSHSRLGLKSHSSLRSSFQDFYREGCTWEYINACSCLPKFLKSGFNNCTDFCWTGYHCSWYHILHALKVESEPDGWWDGEHWRHK